VANLRPSVAILPHVAAMSQRSGVLWPVRCMRGASRHGCASHLALSGHPAPAALQQHSAASGFQPQENARKLTGNCCCHVLEKLTQVKSGCFVVPRPQSKDRHFEGPLIRDTDNHHPLSLDHNW
jgi:hypothetical protein